MVIVQINQSYKIGSTGKIMDDLNSVILNSGHESYMIAGYSNDHSPSNLYCANKGNSYYPIRKDQVISRLTGRSGYRYKKRTQEIIDWIDNKHPDIIHLHNIHGDWIHLETLFEYIKRKEIRIVWTLHDCWAFTGRCSHFELCGCYKWISECHSCTNNKVYPITYFFDHSRQIFLDKKKWFSAIDNMTIVTPSHWLAKYVEQSFLSRYPLEVIHNGIDTDVFSPTTHVSKYYTKIVGKSIILSVASSWSKTKGFDDLIKLDSRIDHEKYQIVMVGLNNRQLKKIPKTIVGISRTSNQHELSELYSGADVFVNLTYQDNFPTTNLEALSCSLPVITYRTGGSPEAVSALEGYVIEQGNIAAVLDALGQVKSVDKSMCRKSAVQRFNKFDRFNDYIQLYGRLVKR